MTSRYSLKGWLWVCANDIKALAWSLGFVHKLQLRPNDTTALVWGLGFVYKLQLNVEMTKCDTFFLI